jgi:hypothetical protein|tara:strand:- start:902 stop:1030 length:129 start_codon:yes stop_codon:yes gene_type:complete
MNVNYESDLTEEEEGIIEKQLHAPQVGSNANKAGNTLKVGNH